MRQVLFSLGLLVLGVVTAQEEPYQVPGFPPFAPAPKMLELLEDRGDTVLVRHLMGETEIPKNPQRVYADTSVLEALVSIGIVPVAANHVDYVDFPSALAERTRGTTLYPRHSYNIEAVLAAQPDLIVVFDFNDIGFTNNTAAYEQLSAIAPTIVPLVEPVGIWEQTTRDLATVFGLEARAEAALADYREVMDAHCARIRSIVGEESVTILNLDGEFIYLASPVRFREGVGYVPYSVGRLYKECRLSPSADVARLSSAEGGNAPLSIEVFPELQANHLVVYLYSNAIAAFAELTERNLWESIPAVQQGNTYTVDYAEAYGIFSTPETFSRIADAITGEGE